MTASLLSVVCAIGFLAGLMLMFRVPLCGRNPNSPEQIPHVSVIIPARNEETNLPVILHSISVQKTPSVEVIVVDDHSTDRSAEIAASYGATVLPSQPLPEGWRGKTWACYQGALHAAGDMLMFLDADTRLSSEGLKRIVDTCSSEPGVCSIIPYHETILAHEQLSAFFNIVMAASMNAFTVFGRLIEPTGLFGPCLVVRKDDYFAVKGHESVKGEILEHFFMAGVFRKHGIALRCYGGKGTLSFRMYPGTIKDVYNGWRKAFAAGAGGTKPVTLAAIIIWLAGAAAAILLPVIALMQWSPAAALWGLAAYLMYAGEMFWMLRRIGRYKLYTVVLYPVSLAFYFIVFGDSLYRSLFGKRVVWKGRSV